MESSNTTVNLFIASINKHNADELAVLVTHDHLFIDAHGGEVRGKLKIRQVWVSYFQMFPDYEIDITEMISKDELVAVFGFASGTFKHLKTENNEYYWKLPISIKAVVIGNKIKQWQVYADTKIPFDIMNRNIDAK